MRGASYATCHYIPDFESEIPLDQQEYGVELIVRRPGNGERLHFIIDAEACEWNGEVSELENLLSLQKPPLSILCRSR